MTIFRPSQPTSVTTGVLPLAAKTHGEAGEIDRAAFLLSTLDRRWQDKTPLRLIIVAPSDDVPAIGNALRSTPRVQVDLRTEEEFFDRDEAFQALPGWWKQQVIKLVVPAVLRLGPYLTFDADVVCVRDFDGRTFVREGQLVSQWYRQYRNGWWAATARFLGLPYEPSALGLDVTPNVLHSDLAASSLWRLALTWLALLGLTPSSGARFPSAARPPACCINGTKRCRRAGGRARSFTRTHGPSILFTRCFRERVSSIGMRRRPTTCRCSRIPGASGIPSSGSGSASSRRRRGRARRSW